MPRMSLQERRQRLIEAAATVVARDGLSAATTRAIVAEAGMPLASFHYAFESHSALMRQVMLKVVSEDLELIAQVVDGDNFVDAIERGLNAYLDSLRENAQHEQGLLELFHYALRTPEHRGLATEAIEMTYGGLEAGLQQFATAHDIRFTVPVRQIAIQLLTLTDGLTLAVLISGDSDLLRATIPPLARGFEIYVSPA